MKYTITINQVGIVRAGLHKKTDLIDWTIIDYLKDWFFAENKRTVLNSEDGKQYTWVNYNHLIENMPLLNIKDKDAIANRFKKLRKLGLIKTITLKDNTMFFVLTDYCISTCFYQDEKIQPKKTNKNNDLQEQVSKSDDLSYDDRTGYPMEIGQGLSYGDRTAQIVTKYQIETNNSNSVYTTSKKDVVTQEYKKHLDYVLLSEEEYNKLLERLGEEKTQEYIEALNSYIAQIGEKRAKAKYKSHYYVILNWFRMDQKRVEHAVKVREAIKKKYDW